MAARLRGRVSGMSGAGDRGPRGIPGATNVDPAVAGGRRSVGKTFAQSLSAFILAGQRSTVIGYSEDGVIAQGADNGTSSYRSPPFSTATPGTVIPPGPQALDPQRGTLARRFHAVAN